MVRDGLRHWVPVRAVRSTVVRRLAPFVALLATVIVSCAVAQMLLNPAPEERAQTVLVLAAPGVLGAIALPVLRRLVSNRARIASAVFAVGLSALAVGTMTSAVLSNSMFLSGHDYRLFVTLLVLASGVGVVVGLDLTVLVARDICRLGAVATAVAEGDLNARTRIERHDEVGQAARAIDRMVIALAHAESDRRTAAIARDHLLSGLGHDLRTPVTAARLLLESVVDGVAPDGDRSIGAAIRQLVMLESLLAKVRDFAVIEAMSGVEAKEVVSIAELVDDAVEAMAPLARQAQVRISSSVHGAGLTMGVPMQLSRVLRNLLDNAVGYSPIGGVVHIAVEDSTMVRIRVVDDGPGFPPDFRAIAFEPFTRADVARSSSGSVGLGLAICRSIVTDHGGSITATAGPGGCVEVQLLPAGRSGVANRLRAVADATSGEHDQARDHGDRAEDQQDLVPSVLMGKQPGDAT